MDTLFGVSLNLIMAVLVGLLGLALASLGYVVLRNRVMFLIGVRNIPRRRAQTILIVLGLMLSTLIISAAFTTGDTIDYSITNQAVETLGQVDELVRVSTGGDEAEFQFAASIEPPAPFDQRQAQRLYDGLAGNEDVDGVVAFSWELAPAANIDARQTEPVILLTGVDAGHLAGFEADLVTVEGAPVDLASLPEGQIYVNESAADDLAIQTGHTLRLFIRNEPVTFTVAGVLKDRLLAGTGAPGFRKGAVLPLDRLQRLFGNEGVVDFVAISNRGGERSGMDLSDAVVADVRQLLEGTNLQVRPTKLDQVELAEQFGNVMTTFFVILGLFSIAAGMLLIFMIFVMLAAERKTEMGISRAIGLKRWHLIETFLSEGMAYNVVAAAVGAALGVLVSMGMTRVMAILFGVFDLAIVFHVTPRSLIISYSLGVVLTFVTVAFSSWRVSVLNIVLAIRDLPEPQLRRAGWRSLAAGLAGLGLGALLVWAGFAANQAFPFMFGVTLFGICSALTLRFFGAPERPLFTSIGLAILAFWTLAAGDTLEPITGDMNGGIELFFLSGLAMVASATYVLVYNVDIFLWALARAGRLFTRALPAVKTAVAYPSQYKFRSGMTIMMIGLVVFALTMMSTMNANYDRLFLSEDARGGWDIEATDSPSNPIADISFALRDTGAFDVSQLDAWGKLGVAHAERPGVQQLDANGVPYEEPKGYTVYLAEPQWLRETRVPLRGRARGYQTDRDVWQALIDDPSKVVIDSFALPDQGFGFGPPSFRLRNVEFGANEFDPIPLRIVDKTSGVSRDVELIGIIATGASTTYNGLYLPRETFAAVLGRPMYNTHFIRLKPGIDSGDAAKAIEAALLERGVQADSIEERVAEEQRLSSAFLYLLQGFMGIGLFVGIAAVGVIAFRTVVERRQQIGMLRAIGFTRGMVGMSFFLESAFITSLGVLSGIGLALLLSNRLLLSSSFGDADFDSFYVPWLQVLGIGAFAFLSSVLMTIIPARQAASIPIAEALRYE